MVSKYPPLESLSPEDQDRLQQRMKAEEIEEDAPEESNGQVASLADLYPSEDGFRYTERSISGIAKKVRFRSFTGDIFDRIKGMDDRYLLVYSICDEQGRLCIPPEEIDGLVAKWDARTYIELLRAANEHCLPSLTIGALVEEAAKNSPETG